MKILQIYGAMLMFIALVMGGYGFLQAVIARYKLDAWALPAFCGYFALVGLIIFLIGSYA